MPPCRRRSSRRTRPARPSRRCDACKRSSVRALQAPQLAAAPQALVKVIVSLDAESFGVWEKDNFAPEGAFLAALEAIEGISNVETQTFTLMPL